MIYEPIINLPPALTDLGVNKLFCDRGSSWRESVLSGVSLRCFVFDNEWLWLPDFAKACQSCNLPPEDQLGYYYSAYCKASNEEHRLQIASNAIGRCRDLSLKPPDELLSVAQIAVWKSPQIQTLEGLGIFLNRCQMLASISNEEPAMAGRYVEAATQMIVNCSKKGINANLDELMLLCGLAVQNASCLQECSDTSLCIIANSIEGLHWMITLDPECYFSEEEVFEGEIMLLQRLQWLGYKLRYDDYINRKYKSKGSRAYRNMVCRAISVANSRLHFGLRVEHALFALIESSHPAIVRIGEKAAGGFQKMENTIQQILDFNADSENPNDILALSEIVFSSINPCYSNKMEHVDIIHFINALLRCGSNSALMRLGMSDAM